MLGRLVVAMAGAIAMSVYFDAEQALRPDQKHRRHGEINQKQRDALEVGLAERVGDADQDAADEGAAQAAHAADDDDDEGRNEDFRIHPGIKSEHWGGSDPA